MRSERRRVAQVACLQATWVASPEEVEVIRPIGWARLNSDFCRSSLPRNNTEETRKKTPSSVVWCLCLRVPFQSISVFLQCPSVATAYRISHCHLLPLWTPARNLSPARVAAGWPRLHVFRLPGCQLAVLHDLTGQIAVLPLIGLMTNDVNCSSRIIWIKSFRAPCISRISIYITSSVPFSGVFLASILLEI